MNFSMSDEFFTKAQILEVRDVIHRMTERFIADNVAAVTLYKKRQAKMAAKKAAKAVQA